MPELFNPARLGYAGPVIRPHPDIDRVVRDWRELRLTATKETMA